MRRDGKRLKGVDGYTKINQSIINSTYFKPRSGFHFIKDNPLESHVLIQCFDSDENTSKVFQNKTIIPNMGEFEAIALHEDASGAVKGRFSKAPGGNVAYCNQKESLIWGGDEMSIAGFMIHHLGNSPSDYWEKVLTDDSDTYAQLSGATTFYIGSNRRIDKVKIYVKTPNGSAATMAVYEYTLGKAGFQAVSGLIDGTSSGGKSLAQTGVVSWDYNSKTRATFVEDGDILAYWYKFEVDGADSETSIYYVTVGESQFRHIENIWDGTPLEVARFWYSKASTGVSDFTDEINEDSQLSYAEIKDMTTSDSIIVGFSQKMRGLILNFVNIKVNSNSSGVSVQFWNANVWSGVTGLYDGTDTDGKTFGKNGMIHWIPTEEMSAESLETKKTENSNELLYYYRITVSSGLSSDIQIYYVSGIPAQDAKGDYKDIGGY